VTLESIVGLRKRLFALAYRIVGDAQAADDVAQDALERWLEHASEVRDPRAWLERVTVRIALDHLKSAHVRRETYVGPWLPEALPTSEVLLLDNSGERELLSLAFLAILERLSPLERVAFLLVESFDYTPAEVAAVIERSEPAVRQLLHRAREHVRENRPRFAPDRQAHLAMLETFLHAVREGDVSALEQLLVADARAVTDGGGRAKAALNIITGADRVARFIIGVFSQLKDAIDIAIVDVNGWPSMVASAGKQVVSLGHIETDGARIYALHAISNPQKLMRLPAGGDRRVTAEPPASS
jgi:RNA polymerase sigma-70 factor, ECF subfamily